MAGSVPIGRRVLLWAGLCLGAAVILVVLALAFLALPPGEALIKAFAESQLEDALRQKVTIADLETNLFSRLELTDLRAHPQDDTSSPSVVHVHRLTLRYNLWGLFRRELRLTSVVADSVTITFERDTTGRSNLAVVDSLDVILSDTTALPITVLLDRLSLTRLHCDLRDGLLGWQAQVRGAEIQLDRAADDTYRYRLHVPQTAAVYDSIPVDLTSLFCEGSWREDRLDVDTLSLSLDGLTLAGHGTTTFPDSVISAEITLAGRPEALIRAATARYGLSPVTADGPLQCLIRVQGTTASPLVQLLVTTPPLQYETVRFGGGQLAMSLARDTLTIDSITVGVGRGMVTAQGRVAADSTLWSDVNIRLVTLDIHQLAALTAEQTPPVFGVLSGDATLSGPIADWSVLRVDATLRTRNLKYGDRSIPDLSARASLIGGAADAEVTGGGVTLHADGRFQEERISGTFRIAIPDLETVARATNLTGVGGTITVNGLVSGTLDVPVVTATADGRNIRYRNWPLDSLSAHLRYEAESFYIEDATFGGAWRSTDSAHALFDLYDLTGALSYQGSASGPVASLDADVTLDVRDLGTSAGPRLSGRTELGIRRDRTATISSRLTADSLAFALNGQADLADSTASLALLVSERAAQRRADPDEGTDTSAGTAVAEFAARADGIGSDHFAVSLDGNIDDIGALVRQWSDTLTASGRMALTVSASGNLDDPHVTCDLQMYEVQYDVWHLDSLFAHIGLDRETIRCDSLTAFTAAGHTVVFAEIPIQRDTVTFYTLATSRPGCGSMQIPELDLTLFRPLLADSADIAGTMAADLSWEGPVSAPTVSGWASLADVRFAAGPLTPPVEEVQAHLSFVDSVVTIERMSGRLRGYPFDVSGWVGLRGTDEFRGVVDCDLADLGTLRAQGEMVRDTLEVTVQTQALRLAALSPFVPTMGGLRGSVDTDVHLYGTRAIPQAEGRLTVSDLSLCHPMLDSCLTDGRIALSFSGNRVQVDTLFARYGQGVVTASGWAIRTDTSLAAADLELSARRIRYNRPKTVSVVVDSVFLHFTQNEDGSLLQGEIALGPSRVVARVRPQALVPWARSVERTRPPLPAMLANMRLDLRLRGSDSLWIDNNLARVRVSVALAATGNIARPAVAGRVGIEEGYLLYLDRRFTVREGQLLFADPETINPEVVLRADTRVTTYSGMIATPYVVTIIAEGTPADLTVDLYSDPPLDKGDILALLTVGATRSQFSGGDGNGEGGTRDVLIARSAELAGQRVAGFLTNRVGGVLGLEEVSVEGNIFRTGGPDEARLLASRRLGGRLKLTYSTAVGHLNDQALRLNYSLSRRFSLEGQTTQQGRSVLGLQYSVPIK